MLFRSGYGIGLSVARAIAEKHGGTIKVRQTPEGRVRFECLLVFLEMQREAGVCSRVTAGEGIKNFCLFIDIRTPI